MSVRLRGGVGPVRVSVPLVPRGLVRGLVALFWWMGVGVWLMTKFIYWQAPRWAWRKSRTGLARFRTGPQQP